MLLSMYYSNEAWLEAFLEHSLFSEYLALAWTEIDAEHKLRFDFANRKCGDEVVSLYIGLSKGAPIVKHKINFFSRGVACNLKEFVSAISNDNPSGAINPFLALMLDVEKRVTFMLEVAQKHGDIARVRSAFAFEYKYFPFLNNELERLQVIRTCLHVNARAKAP
jgi:hypothetical protein